MSFIIEVFWALLMVGIPICAFTTALVYWVLKGTHSKGSLDSDALRRDIAAMTKGNKKNKKDKEAEKERKKNLHPLQKKWGKFGGGFYGIVAFFTYIVVEVIEIITVISDFGGFIDFIKQLNINVIVEMFVQALMNFITAITWPAYWMKRIETDQVWIWFLMAYAGYWAGLKLVEILIQNRSQPVT